MVKKLPSDFDILSPSMRTNPLCIQTFAKRVPVLASDWAISHS